MDGSITGDVRRPICVRLYAKFNLGRCDSQFHNPNCKILIQPQTAGGGVESYRMYLEYRISLVESYRISNEEFELDQFVIEFHSRPNKILLLYYIHAYVCFEWIQSLNYYYTQVANLYNNIKSNIKLSLIRLSNSDCIQILNIGLPVMNLTNGNRGYLKETTSQHKRARGAAKPTMLIPPHIRHCSSFKGVPVPANTQECRDSCLISAMMTLRKLHIVEAINNRLGITFSIDMA